MAFQEDFSPFFSTGEFAERATLDGVAVAGMVEAGFSGASLDGYGGAGSAPRFTLPSAGLPARPGGLPLVILTGPAAGSYRVANTMPDGTGLTTLDLIES